MRLIARHIIQIAERAFDDLQVLAQMRRRTAECSVLRLGRRASMPIEPRN